MKIDLKPVVVKKPMVAGRPPFVSWLGGIHHFSFSAYRSIAKELAPSVPSTN